MFQRGIMAGGTLFGEIPEETGTRGEDSANGDLVKRLGKASKFSPPGFCCDKKRIAD